MHLPVKPVKKKRCRDGGRSKQRVFELSNGPGLCHGFVSPWYGDPAARDHQCYAGSSLIRAV